MSSLMTRGSILLFSRFSNIVIQIISPILLVRLLDLKSYGQLQAFNLYSLVLLNICAFGISSNLLYFLKKIPEKAKIIVSNTVCLLFCASVIAIAAVIILRDVAFGKVNIDITLQLVVYVFFGLNMSFWDTYWLANKKALNVLYYSSSIMLIRVVGLLIIALFQKNVIYLIWWLCIVQISRFLFVLIISTKNKWYTLRFDKDIIIKQFAYFTPLGIANAIRYLNNTLGHIFVASLLGVEALAIYAIGSRYLPVVTLVKSTIVDTVFPDMVELGQKSDGLAFKLWQKANILLIGTILPFFVVGEYYAGEIIKYLFTTKYIGAVPIFRIFLVLMLVQAFEFTLPIRNKNKNIHIIVAGIIRLIVNLVLIIILTNLFGIIGPAIAAVSSGILETIYLVFAVYKLYNFGIIEILIWKKGLKIFGTATGGLIFFLIFGFFFNPNIFSVVTTTIFFFVAYSYFLWIFDIEEFKILIKWCEKKIIFSINR